MYKNRLNKIKLLCASMVILFGVANILYAKMLPRDPNVKTTVELIDQAKQEGKIDEDTAILYKYYDYNGMKHLIPKELSGANAWGDMRIEAGPFLPDAWNNLRAETKKKILDASRRGKYEGSFAEDAAPKIELVQPRDTEVVYKPDIMVKGQIRTPEIYELKSAWVEIGRGGPDVIKRYEIKLPQPEYMAPKEIFQEKTYGEERGKKYYLEIKEKYKDKPGLAELWGPPGHKVYRFNETLTLPGPGAYQILVDAENEAGRITYTEKSMTSKWVVYAQKEAKSNTFPVIKITGIKDGARIKESQIRIGIETDDKDKDLILSQVYFNGRQTGWQGESYLSGAGDYPLELGKNILEVIAIDRSGNKSEKRITIYLEK